MSVEEEEEVKFRPDSEEEEEDLFEVDPDDEQNWIGWIDRPV